MSLRKTEQDFLHFVTIFDLFYDLSHGKVWAPILKILRYMLKNLSKNEEKSLYKVPLKITFLQGTSKTQNPDFEHTTQVSGIIRSVTNSH